MATDTEVDPRYKEETESDYIARMTIEKTRLTPQEAMLLNQAQMESNKSKNAQGGYSEPDKVDHPAHHISKGGIETIDVIESYELDPHRAFAIKHILRAGRKEGEPFERDIEKAIWYLRRLLQHRDK